ncbi:MAG TPA: cytoplasmic protein [Pseudoneobacillus sp.]|nr:cytoplasmic protein [Pseudoneobacillus sp.]
MENQYKEQDLQKAHQYSRKNRIGLERNNVCGCFHCLRIFNPNEIDEWLDDNDTAECPYCGIDSVIGESSGFPITQPFLKEMQKMWF